MNQQLTLHGNLDYEALIRTQVRAWINNEVNEI